jgi:hypothetical protein
MPSTTGRWGPHKLAAELGTAPSLVDQARDLGLIAPPDDAGRWWSAAAVADIRGRWPQIVAAIHAAREFGAVRCAELLTRRTGLPVRAGHVEKMAALGMVRATRYYRKRPLYRVSEVEALAADALSRARLADIVNAR